MHDLRNLDVVATVNGVGCTYVIDHDGSLSYNVYLFIDGDADAVPSGGGFLQTFSDFSSALLWVGGRVAEELRDA